MKKYFKSYSKKSVVIIFLYSACAVMFMVACKSNKPEEKQDITQSENGVEFSDAQFKNAKIETGRIIKQHIASLIKVNGIIDVPPQNMVSISAPLGGYLKSTSLLPGMHINKGEILAIMEDQLYISLQQEYLSAKARLLYAEDEFRRQDDLNKSKAASDKMFQEAKMKYTDQKVLLKSLSEKLKLIGIDPDSLNEANLSRSINLKSPIDGYVSHVKINIGKYANPSDILFELVNPTDIHLALDIFEKDIDKLFIGQKLMAFTNSYPEKKYPCEVILIGKNLSKDRSVEVHCHFENYDKSLIPGMYMNAEMEVMSANAYVIPNDAIVRFEGKQFVFMQIGDKKFEMKNIQTLNTENGLTQISFPDSLDVSSKKFVTKNAYTLLMKMKNSEE